MARKFQRRTESFDCLNCGAKISGNGYTNHCPQCLFSRHVDINPGDRLESCLGLMEPCAVELKGSEIILIHRCVKCGFTRKNKRSMEDNYEKILQIIREKG